MKHETNTTPDALHARLADLEALSERGELGVTPYLTPREVLYAQKYLASRIKVGTAYFLGGHPHAERMRAVLLPTYTEGMLPDIGDTPLSLALADVGLDDLAREVLDVVAVLYVCGSGFRNLVHRDYLGSVLGLGLERDVLGDILVKDDHSAYLFCKGEICPFLMEHLTHVGSDPVKVSRLDPTTPIDYQKNTLPIHDTIASPRLDCIVASLCNLSREKAQTTIQSGLVELNYEPCDACNQTVMPPAVLSVRGVGKFTVIAFGGETRKGRLRLVAEKYV